jgi:hypothetical protein
MADIFRARPRANSSLSIATIHQLGDGQTIAYLRIENRGVHRDRCQALMSACVAGLAGAPTRRYRDYGSSMWDLAPGACRASSPPSWSITTGYAVRINYHQCDHCATMPARGPIFDGLPPRRISSILFEWVWADHDEYSAPHSSASVHRSSPCDPAQSGYASVVGCTAIRCGYAIRLAITLTCPDATPLMVAGCGWNVAATTVNSPFRTPDRRFWARQRGGRAVAQRSWTVCTSLAIVPLRLRREPRSWAEWCRCSPAR